MHKTAESLGLVSGIPQTEFAPFTKFGARLLDAPVSLVSIVDESSGKQYFPSRQGLTEPYISAGFTPLSHSFCATVAHEQAVSRVNDARLDPRFQNNPAIEDLKVVAYLGAPVFGPDGGCFGAFCVIDSQPRNWTDDQELIVVELAGCVSDQIIQRALVQTASELVDCFERLRRLRQTPSFGN